MKKLQLQKRGTDLCELPHRPSSDLENCRLFFEFTDKNGKYVYGDAMQCDFKYRFNHKYTGKPLKKPIKEKANRLCFQLATEREDGLCYHYEHEREMNSKSYEFTIADLLKAVNEYSTEKYDDIEYVNRIGVN